MKRSLIIFSILTLGIASACSVLKKSEADNGPTKPAICNEINADTIMFDKTINDFGDIPYQGDGSTVFTFYYCGDSIAYLKNVRASCGCTTPDWPKDTLYPGDSAVIKVKYDTKRVGNFNKYIYVTTSLYPDQLKLIIKGKVGPKPTQPEGN